MKKGWICLHRKLLDNPIGRNPELVGAWAIFLLSASHKETSFFFGLQKITLRGGEFIWGRKKFAERWRCSESRAYRILKSFESERMVVLKVNNRFTRVKVLKWRKYQQKKVLSEQPVNSPPTTGGQPVNTYNNEEQCTTTPRGVEEEKVFKKFIKWLRETQEQIKNPERYAVRIFTKYPWEILQKVLNDQIVTSLPKFSQLADFYLKRKRDRG